MSEQSKGEFLKEKLQNYIEQSKGEFLKEKLQNMARWVDEEVGKENLPVDIIAGIAGRSAVEATLFASQLAANKAKVTHRDWSGLVQVMAQETLPIELQEVIVAIQHRPPMHDKFWRYMGLFIEVADQ
jgi:hypothetical protein